MVIVFFKAGLLRAAHISSQRAACQEEEGAHLLHPDPRVHLLYVTPVFPMKTQVQIYMHARIKFHAYS
jgi:hypothetical protein